MIDSISICHNASIHLLLQFYSLSYTGMEEALIEVPAVRRCASLEFISDRIHDETTIVATVTNCRGTN